MRAASTVHALQEGDGAAHGRDGDRACGTDAIADCRLCRSSDLTEVLSLGNQAFTGIFPKSREVDVPMGPLTLLRCGDCGLVQLGHTYDPAVLYGSDYGYRSGLNGSMVKHLNAKVAWIEEFTRLRKGQLVIDIGSNDGTLLKGYKTPGLRMVGIDPTIEEFDGHYDALGSDGVWRIPEMFSADAVRRCVGQQAQVITSIAMFYDLPRPLDFAKDVVSLLAEDGIWVIEQSYLPSMVKNRAYDTICHEHLEYYALKQIVWVAERLGLKIVDLLDNDVNGGSFSVVLAKEGSRYPSVDDRVALMLEHEAALGFDSPAPFQMFSFAMGKQRRRLVELLEGLKQQGKLVLGYGASTKGNVLLQWCGITEYLLPAIAEVNESKFGAFTPGTKIPIISEAEARRRHPDCFLVLPWHFRSSIIEREAEFLANGGELIFPLPDLDVWSCAR